MKLIVFILVNFYINVFFAQFKQLIPDSSFEDNNILWDANAFNNADSLNKRSKHWKSPTDGTPDLFSFDYIKNGHLKLPIIYEYSLDSTYQIIKKDTLFLNPTFGNSLVGFFIRSAEKTGVNYKYYKEYIQTKLKDSIKINHKYKLNFNIQKFKFSGFSVYDYIDIPLGFYFSEKIITNRINNNCYLNPNCTSFKENYIPQLEFDNFSPSDQNNLKWESINKSFKLTKGYNYLTIGVFKSDQYILNNYNSNKLISSNFFLDDISLIELPCIVSPDTVCNKSITPLYTTLGMPYYWSSDRLGKDTLSKDSVFNFNGIKSQWIYAFGKYGTDSSFIHVMPSISNPFIIDTFHICSGNSQILNAFIGHTFQYLWKTGETASSINVQKKGTYQVQISDSFSCKESFKTNVVVHSLPKTYLAPDTINCFVSNPIVTIRPQGNFTCFWQPLNIQNCEIQINKAQILQLKIKSIPYQCESDYEIVIKDICEPLVYIPNVFKPNSEIEVNQVFKPSVYYSDNYTMKIFNRWGEKVFETNNAIDSWDGTFHGELCAQGVYLCILELNSLTPNNISKTYRQLLHLLR
jgi:gliding motility-associated-like protein